MPETAPPTSALDTIRSVQLRIPEADQVIDAYRNELVRVESNTDLNEEARDRFRRGVRETAERALREVEARQRGAPHRRRGRPHGQRTNPGRATQRCRHAKLSRAEQN